MTLSVGAFNLWKEHLSETDQIIVTNIYDTYLDLKLEPQQSPRSGCLMHCGCWYLGKVGDWVGMPVSCPAHGPNAIIKANVPEPLGGDWVHVGAVGNIPELDDLDALEEAIENAWAAGYSDPDNTKISLLQTALCEAIAALEQCGINFSSGVKQAKVDFALHT